MKVLIVDNKEREIGLSQELKTNKNIRFETKTESFETLSFDKCLIIFKHNTFNYDVGEHKKRIIFIEFSGGGILPNEIAEDSKGYKFKATIKNTNQINNVLRVIDKTELTKEDLEMILNFDSRLEELLLQFYEGNSTNEEKIKTKQKLISHLETVSNIS